MKTVVVTGSSRGIGFGLARSFVERGCNVVVSGRSQEALDRAVAQLSSGGSGSSRGAVFGAPCDVTRREQVEALWSAAANRFGKVDVWINNAGSSHAPVPFWKLAPAKIDEVLESNLHGMMNGCFVAMRGMQAQGSGHIYNMEGFGSDGATQVGMAIYVTVP